MKPLRFVMAGTAIAALLGAATEDVKAGLLTNGSLTIEIREDNGAIDEATFGEPFFDLGTHVADYGFQKGNAPGTFAYNTTHGGEGVPATVSGGNLVTGTFTEGGLDVSFTRSYALVPGLNVLRVTTTFENNKNGPAQISYFDAFDPDQGPSSATDNDVFSIAGGSAVEAVNGRAVLAGSTDPRVVVGVHDELAINSGGDLNAFFNTPLDPDGATSDVGFAIGLRTTIEGEGMTSFVYDLAFGDSSLAARNAFSAANDNGVIPEPATLALLGMGGAMIGCRRRQPTA